MSLKNLKIVNQILKTKKKISKNQQLNNFVWDSMAMIELITILEKKSKKKINTNQIRGLKNIDDLDKFIEKYK